MENKVIKKKAKPKQASKKKKDSNNLKTVSTFKNEQIKESYTSSKVSPQIVAKNKGVINKAKKGEKDNQKLIYLIIIGVSFGGLAAFYYLKYGKPAVSLVIGGVGLIIGIITFFFAGKKIGQPKKSTEDDKSLREFLNKAVEAYYKEGDIKESFKEAQNAIPHSKLKNQLSAFLDEENSENAKNPFLNLNLSHSGNVVSYLLLNSYYKKEFSLDDQSAILDYLETSKDLELKKGSITYDGVDFFSTFAMGLVIVFYFYLCLQTI